MPQIHPTTILMRQNYTNHNKNVKQLQPLLSTREARKVPAVGKIILRINIKRAIASVHSIIAGEQHPRYGSRSTITWCTKTTFGCCCGGSGAIPCGANDY